MTRRIVVGVAVGLLLTLLRPLLAHAAVVHVRATAATNPVSVNSRISTLWTTTTPVHSAVLDVDVPGYEYWSTSPYTVSALTGSPSVQSCWRVVMPTVAASDCVYFTEGAVYWRSPDAPASFAMATGQGSSVLYNNSFMARATTGAVGFGMTGVGGGSIPSGAGTLYYNPPASGSSSLFPMIPLWTTYNAQTSSVPSPSSMVQQVLGGGQYFVGRIRRQNDGAANTYTVEAASHFSGAGSAPVYVSRVSTSSSVPGVIAFVYGEDSSSFILYDSERTPCDPSWTTTGTYTINNAGSCISGYSTDASSIASVTAVDLSDTSLMQDALEYEFLRSATGTEALLDTLKDSEAGSLGDSFEAFGAQWLEWASALWWPITRLQEIADAT